MGKMSELASELAELKHCGEVLISISETLTEMFSAADDTQVSSNPNPVKETELEREAPPAATEVKQSTLVDVRKVMTEKSRSGHTGEIKALLGKYGTGNLSGLDPKYYAAILAEAEAIGNA